MSNEIRLCLTLTEEIENRLKSIFESQRNEELTRIVLFDVADCY